MVAATAGTVLMIVIGLSSWRRVRQLIPYETWYFVHLTGYLAVLLGFGHQLTLGADFATDTLAFWWWSALFVAAFVLISYARLGDLVRSVSRRFYVTAVSREANGIGSLHVSGPGLRGLRVAGGQFFNVRALTGDLWWQTHPFSVSAAPTTAGLRFTIKELGEDSTRILQLRPGHAADPRGPVRRVHRRAGGGGAGRARGRGRRHRADPSAAGGRRSAPAPRRDRARPRRCRRRPSPGARAHGRRAERHAPRAVRSAALVRPERSLRARRPSGPGSPISPARHVFVCGPASLESAVMKGMRKAGVPAGHIHHERFGV